MNISAYPLSWPGQFPRTKNREAGQFRTSLGGALNNVQKSLELFASDSNKKLENLTISSNVTLGVNNPTDPGVSVWFGWDGLQVCIPVDRYTRVEGNLQAIHHIVEARRVELRHGTLALVRASFTGFLSLPAPTEDDWSNVLGVSIRASNEEVERAYKKLRSKWHPDREGGNAGEFSRVQQAYDKWKELNA